ncbi:MAG: DUF21 domain-containing protein [Verrucomicrobiota bacterium]
MTTNRLPHWVLILSVVFTAGILLPFPVESQDVPAPSPDVSETTPDGEEKEELKENEEKDGPKAEAKPKGSYSLLIICVLVTLVFSFLCSVAEAVLLSVTRPFIATLKEKGGKAGQILGELKADINRPLAAILTLNTIAHTLGAAGAGAAAAALWIDTANPDNSRMWLYLTFNAVFVFLILFGSEIIPKTLGATYWRGLAPMTRATNTQADMHTGGRTHNVL